MQKAVVYRPKGNLVWGSVALLLDALYLVQVLFWPVEGEALWFDLLIAAVVAAVAILIWLRPKLVLGTDALVVVNPLRVVTISYSDITELDTKWTLHIYHAETSTRVWVAPANGKFRWIAESNQSRISKRLPRNENRVVDVTSMSASHNSDSGVAAALIRERVEGLH